MFNTNNPKEFTKLIDLSKLLNNPKITLSGELNDNIDELILSDFWPSEVDISSIVTTHDDISQRAKAIISTYGLQKGNKFLDVGCGEGQCSIEASKQGVISFGFDIKICWNDSPTNKILTNDINIVKQNAPYDVVALYDVVDHIIDRNNCIETLRTINTVCTQDTKIYVRCHPWTSRHGGHLYTTINKAFAHIALSNETLSKINYKPVRKIINPTEEYQLLFDKGGFDIVFQNNIIHPLDEIFQTNQLITFFEKKHKNKKLQTYFNIEFIDYILKIKHHS